MAHFPQRQSFTTRQIRETANRGQILQMRAGQVVKDHGDTRVSSNDYGNGIREALAQALPGDTIMARSIRAAGQAPTGAVFALDVPNVRVLCEDVTLIPDGNYDYLLEITANATDCTIHGLTLDGLEMPNTSDGFGLVVHGDRAVIRNCEVSRIMGDTLVNGHGSCTYITGEDVLIDQYTSHGGMYSSIIAHSANRLKLFNLRIFNPGDRAINLQGGSPVDYVEIDSCVGVMNTGSGQTAGVFMNVNPSAVYKTLRISNYHMTNSDVIATGVSYNFEGTLGMMKIQNVEELHLSHVTLKHGTNAFVGPGPTYYHTHSLRFETGSYTIPRCYFTDCDFSGSFGWGDQYAEYVRWERCQLGADIMEAAAQSYTFHCKDFAARDCVFNLHAGGDPVLTTVPRMFTVSSDHAPTDRVAIRDCLFLADTPLRCSIFNRHIMNSVGNNVLTGNSLVNSGYSGSGEGFVLVGDDSSNRTAVTYGNLASATNANGDLLFDKNNIWSGSFDAAGEMPIPGSTSPYFVGMPVPTTGRIVNDGVANGTTTITSATASFVAGDVGQLIWVYGGTGSIVGNFRTINSVTNATTIVVSGSVLTAGTAIHLRIGSVNGQRIKNVYWSPGDAVPSELVARDGTWVAAP